MNRLSEAEFLATMAELMKRMPSTAQPPLVFWDYFDAIPTEDFEGHDCSEGSLDNVWQDPSESFQHVLVNSKDKNVFMVIVLDVANSRVLGHRLLNLNREYGLPGYNSLRLSNKLQS